MHRLPHSTYYRDRDTEYNLCQDFPGDEILIDGLHAMQLHFWNNNIGIEIPVVQVMNTAHYLAAYMFATTCSGDQLEYDVLAYDSMSRDKQLTRVALIVLAAMLKRTDGFRAQNCRNLILENREPDFDCGVTLYDQFLCSAEKRFSEEDFLIDTHAQILALKAENTELKIKYHVMEEKYQQINIGTQNNNCTINNYFGYNPASTSIPTDEPKKETSPIIRDGHLYLYDDNENAPKEEHLEQQSLEIAYFQENLKQWVMDNTSAVKKFIEAKSKEFEGIVFTAEDVLVHEDGLAHAIGELFAQEYSYYLPVDLVRHAECESVEQEMRCDNPGDKLYPYGPYMLTIRLWLAKNHSVEEVQQYIDTLNWDKINQTIIAIILPYVGIQKYLYLTQQKLGEIGAWTREHNQSKKRKAMEEKDQMSFNFD